QEGDRQLGLLALPDQVAQRVVRDVAAGLHVVDAGAEHAVTLAADPEVLLDHADRMHGIEMRQHQDALALAPRRAALEDVAKAVATGHAIQLEAQVAELALDLVDHDVDCLAVVAGTFDRHPLDDAVEDLLWIDLRFVLQLRHQTGSQVKYSGERLRS